MLRSISFSHLVLLIGTFLPVIAFCQSPDICNINIVVLAEQKSDHIPKKLLLDFLRTFDITCENNVEYSEYSNEVLFLLLSKDLSKVIKTMDKHFSTLAILEISEQIQNPISDIFDLNKIKEHVLAYNSFSYAQPILIVSLDRALAKFNTGIK